MMPSVRYIDTDGLPLGFDVADLVQQGTTGDALIAWMKQRVRPGTPPAEAKPVAVPKQKAPVTVGEQGPAPARSLGETDRGTDVATPLSTVSNSPVATSANSAVAMLPRPKQAPPDEDEALLPPEYSDDSLAREFTRQYHGSFLYVAAWGRWLHWDGARWAYDVTLRAQHAARMVLREQANDILSRQAEFGSKARNMATAVSSGRMVGNVERLARADPKHSADPKQFDADDWALNTPAGIVNLVTGELRPATMRDYCTKVTRVAPGGECPTWLAFLDDVTGGNVEMQQYLQRVAGYALTGSTREHALFFFYGTGRNGKGTFINTLEWILGDYSKVAAMETFTESKNDRHTTEIAALMGARMVTSQETDEGKRWAESRIKSMTGGDPITARFMARDNFTFIPQFKLLISGNHRPGLRNVDEAMKARLHLVPFDITVPPERRDVRLAEKLRAEASGILAWAIKGCKEWDRIRLAPPLAVRKATDEYFQGQDVVGMWLNENCDVGPGVRGNQAELYRDFKRYCLDGGNYAVNRQRWLDALELKGILPTKNNGERCLKNVRIKLEDPFPHHDN
jgi:putative DNA primase/helicase